MAGVILPPPAARPSRPLMASCRLSVAIRATGRPSWLASSPTTAGACSALGPVCVLLMPGPTALRSRSPRLAAFRGLTAPAS
jgi:hypothetical protein